MTGRTILKNLKMTIACLFLSLLANSCTEQQPQRFGGLALYTVRDQMAENPQKTLRFVADTGYKYIEADGYKNGQFYGMSPDAFSLLLQELGLEPVSCHMSMVTLDNADELIEDVRAAGFNYFVVPIPPMGMFTSDPGTLSMGMTGTARELAEILRVLGEKCNAAGLELLYHNHDFEFTKDSEGNVILDYLLENLDPELVNFELDLFWATRAGVDPLDYFEKYPGRFKAWHVKDMDDQGRFAPVGKGSIDFARILAKKEKSGMVFYFVEQDMTFDGQTPLDVIKISHKGIEVFGFE